MITQLHEVIVEGATQTELPDSLYDMMGEMKFSVDRKLEADVANAFDLPLLRKVYPHTTPVDTITRLTKNYIISRLDK